ncbi:MAG: AAA family ATPase [Hyphomonadaceae bacterium]|nr:AAA family ATPase [Hyphomonadaceae bacterium]
MAKKVFISHAHADGAAVGRLKEALRKANCEAWVSTEQIAPDKPFPPPIARAIISADALLVFLTARARQSSWVQSEILFALRNHTPVVVLEFDPVPSTHPLAFILQQATQTISKRGKQERAVLAEAVSAMGNITRHEAPVVSMLNVKGGVGKTTLTANLFFSVAAQHNKRVLLIDCDPQHNLSQMILAVGDLESAHQTDRTVMSAFEPSILTQHESPAKDIISILVKPNEEPPAPVDTVTNLHHRSLDSEFALLPGQVELMKYTMWDKTPEQLNACKFRFHQFMADCRRHFDLIVIDCNPSVSFLTACALEASSHILAPVTADTFSLVGLRTVERLGTAIFGAGNKPTLNVIMNNVPRDVIPRAEQQVRSHSIYGPLTLKSRIHASAFMQTRNLDEAPLNQLDTLALNRLGNGAEQIHRALSDAAAEYTEILWPSKVAAS